MAGHAAEFPRYPDAQRKGRLSCWRGMLTRGGLSAVLATASMSGAFACPDAPPRGTGDLGLVIEARDDAHANEIKARLEQAGYAVRDPDGPNH